MSLLSEIEPREREKPRRPPKRLAIVPWGYGVDRVGAAAIDPYRLYVFWELTDPAIARAREELGDGGTDAWLVLRVHDTTGRIFDGTNAHGYFDHSIRRSDRQWFFVIGKPTSTAVVELGLKTAGGDFVRIARSARVEFPRTEPAPPSEPEWLTVHASGHVEHAGVGQRRRSAEPAPGVSQHGPPPPLPPPPPQQGGFQPHEVPGAWHELPSEWHAAGESLHVVTTWEAGPFAYPIEVEPPLSEHWRGPSRTYQVGNVTHVVEGTWHLVIRNLGAHGERQTLGRWELHRSWITASGGEARSIGPRRARAAWPGASELVAGGASERMWLAGSELRLGGASERWRVGASEVRLGGASERRFAGSSEHRLQGGSELRLQGASEVRLGGSEPRLVPPSPARYPELPETP